MNAEERLQVYMHLMQLPLLEGVVPVEGMQQLRYLARRGNIALLTDVSQRRQDGQKTQITRSSD